jgi:hypothetical protein
LMLNIQLQNFINLTMNPKKNSPLSLQGRGE